MIVSMYLAALLAAPPPQPIPTNPAHPPYLRGTATPGHSFDLSAAWPLLVLLGLALLFAALAYAVRRATAAGVVRTHAARLFAREDLAADLQAAIAKPATTAAAADACGNVAGGRRWPNVDPLRCTLAMATHPPEYHEAWTPTGEFIDSWPVRARETTSR